MIKRLLLVLLLTSAAWPQAWVGVLDPSRAVDWSTAGIPGGIPSRSTICTTLSAGASAASINSAIAACPSGDVVFLNAGTYNLSSGIDFATHSNVTLRGAGANSTFLVFTGYAGCNGANADVCVEGSNNWSGGPQHTANWTAGYSKGTTVITLSSTSGLANGSLLILDQIDTATDTGNLWINASENVSAQEGPAGSERPATVGGVCTTCRSQSQVVTVTNISGSNVTISPGLYMPNWASGNSPGAWWPTTTATGDGIENLSMDHTNSSGASSGVTFNNAYECWLAGVRSIDPNRNHVWKQWSARIVVRDSYFFNTQNHASQSYGVEDYTDSDGLTENNIFQQVTTPIQVNGSASGNVYGYNFTIDNVYNTSPGWMIAGCSLHAAGVDNVLFEGNEMNACIWDNIHGNHNFTTTFRNQFIGWETTKTTQTNAFQIYAAVRYSNIIGNVLGKSGYHTQYQDLASSGTNPNASVYVLGWSGNTGTTGCCSNDTLVASTMMRWGNYDTVNAAVQWNSGEVPSGISPYPNPVPATHNLPLSFYLSGKPSWFGSIPYPPVGPDVSGGNISGVGGYAYENPAQSCYLNTMGGPADGSGSVLAFNPSTCYSSAPPVGPPTQPSLFLISQK